MIIRTFVTCKIRDLRGPDMPFSTNTMMTNGKIQLSPVLRVAVFLVAGIIAGDIFYGYVPLSLWYAAFVLSVLAALFAGARSRLQSLMIFVSFIFLGGVITCYERLETDVCLPENEISYHAVIVSRPVITDKTVKCDMIMTDTGRPLRLRAVMRRDNRACMLRVGDGIKVVSRLRLPAGPGKTGFDYRRWLLRHGYVATAYIQAGNWCRAVVGMTCLSRLERAKIAALRFRDGLLDKYKMLSLDDDSYAVLAAMTLGDKSALTAEVRNDYSASGASHVLALSGLHLGIIYAVLVFLLSGLRRNLFVLPAVVCAEWIYVFIVGMPVSAVRSAVMLTVYSFVGMLNRDRMSLNALAVAAVVILVNSPLDIYDAGFQMSFMAVLSILLLYRPFCRLMPRSVLSAGPVRWVWQLAAVSVAAQIGVAPLVAFYFGSFSCYFLLTNMIVVPVATLILYGALLMIPFGFLPYMQSLLASCLGFIVSLLNSCVSFISFLPGSSITGMNIGLLQLFLIYIIISTVCLLVVYLHKMR